MVSKSCIKCEMMNEASLEEIVLFSEWAIKKYKGMSK